MTAVPPWEDPRRVLSRHGLRPKASFSQNFLVSREAVEAIAEAAGAEPGAAVVELGPGLGTLTAALLRAGAEVWAIEQDRDMIAVLERELGAVPGFHVLPGDAAEAPLERLAAEIGRPIRLAGNLPYSITGAILRRLIESRASLEHAVVMVQREVRDRLLAEPGTKAYGALTVFTQAAFAIEHVRLVRAGCFHPAPKVDSAVVKLSARETPLAEETPAFRAVVRAAFEQRRKTLKNALSSTKRSAGEIDAALACAGIDPRVRGETLSVTDFERLARAFVSP